MTDISKQEVNKGLFFVYLVGFAFSSNYTNHAPLRDILTGIPQYGFDNTRFGLLATGMFLTHAIMQIPGGHLSDTLGAKRVVIMALSVVIFGNFCIIFSNAYWEFIAWKIFIGVGTGGSFIAGARYISQLVPKHRSAKAQAFYGASVLAGSGFVIFIVPEIARHPYLGLLNWQAAFVSTSTLAFLVVISWAFLAPDPPLQSHPKTNMNDLLVNGQLWLLGLVQMASFGLVIVIGNWITVVLKQQVALSPNSAGHIVQLLRSSPKLLNALASMVVLVGVAGRPLGGYLIKRTGMHLLIAVSLLLNAIGCFILTGHQISIEWIMLAILLLGTGCALPYAGLFHGATLLFPGRAGAAKGLVNMLGVLMILMGAPFFGYIKDITGGFYLGFMVMGAFSLLVLFASFKIKKIEI